MFKNPVHAIMAHHQKNILLALLVISSTSLILIAIRLFLAAPSRAYAFLVWNLFLAWIPYVIGLLLLSYHRHITSRWALSAIVLLWILFFPNAPYIATDFFHFDQKPHIPVWFDLIMLFSFAWSGLLLGLLSLRDVQTVIVQKTNHFIGWFFVVMAILFGAVGVYMGRYLRWNSWDVFIDPFELANDLVIRFMYPSQDWRAWGLTTAFSFFLGAAYATLLLLMRNQSDES